MSGELAYESIVVRIDKMPRPRRLPFLGLCVQNGSPRDALQQVVYVRILLRGHRRHIRLFFSMFDTGIWVSPHTCGQSSWGLRTALGRGVRVAWSVVSDVYTGMGDWARQIGAGWRQSVTDFRKFLRSQTGRIIAVYLCHACEGDSQRESGGNANKGGEQRRGHCSFDNYCK